MHILSLNNWQISAQRVFLFANYISKRWYDNSTWTLKKNKFHFDLIGGVLLIQKSWIWGSKSEEMKIVKLLWNEINVLIHWKLKSAAFCSIPFVIKRGNLEAIGCNSPTGCKWRGCRYVPVCVEGGKQFHCLKWRDGYASCRHQRKGTKSSKNIQK